MTYLIHNLRANTKHSVVAANQGQALRAYAAIRTHELNAQTADKQVNTLRTERAENGSYALIKDGAELYRFNCLVKWFVPTVRTDVDRDGTAADWQSGKFHR